MRDRNRKNDPSTRDKNTLEDIAAILQEFAPYTFSTSYLNKLVRAYSTAAVTCKECGGPAVEQRYVDIEVTTCTSCGTTKTEKLAIVADDGH